MNGHIRALWHLDPDVSFLNHGSFGACPKAVLDAQTALRQELERQPVRFFERELEPLLDGAREELAALLGASPAELAFVPNATTGVSTVLRSLRFERGEEILVTDHAYRACRNAVDFVAAAAGAEVVVAKIPFPIDAPERATEALLAAAGARTKLALVDHVTSPTALVLPIEQIVRELSQRGIDVLVDGAHAPGMVALDLGALGAAYYTGNCHKWLCAPKGAGFLWVRRDLQPTIRPLATSHGATSPRPDRSRFHLELDWLGTFDPTPYLCVPEAIRFLSALLPGGLAALRTENRRKALAARDILCRALGVPPPCPDAMIGSMAAVPLPDGSGRGYEPPLYLDPLQQALGSRGIEVPIVPWPASPKRLVRVSAQAYVETSDYERLAAALAVLLAGEKAR